MSDAYLLNIEQNEIVIEKIIELLMNYTAVPQEVHVCSLLLISNFGNNWTFDFLGFITEIDADVVKWIKEGGNLSRLARYLGQFKFTRVALETLHFVMTRPGSITIILIVDVLTAL